MPEHALECNQHKQYVGDVEQLFKTKVAEFMVYTFMGRVICMSFTTGAEQLMSMALQIYGSRSSTAAHDCFHEGPLLDFDQPRPREKRSHNS